MNKTMRRCIEISTRIRQEIADELGCSYMTVFRALNYKKNSRLSMKIRKLALAKGGIPLTVAPEGETLHDADGYMRQYFPNGATIEVRKKTGHVEVISPSGTVVGCVEKDCTVPMLEELQRMAAMLSPEC